MDHIDEFESIFKRADKTSFEYQQPSWNRISLITDTESSQSEAVQKELLSYLPGLNETAQIQTFGKENYSNVVELLDQLRKKPSELIVTYRHLFEEQHIPQHSLGVYVDVLTQTLQTPVLLLPGTAKNPESLAERSCEDVLVITDHISGEDRLVNFGISCTPEGGQLFLVHIEDDVVFEQYMHVIEQIPELDSSIAREQISQQLLKNAVDYQTSCEEIISNIRSNIQVHSVARRGHRLRDFQSLIDEHDIDLLVMNTKDDDQLAMHGMAYSLSVELTHLPLLLL